VLVQPGKSSASVFRNASRGEGAFASTALPTATSAVFNALMVDSHGTIWSALDNPTLYLVKSTDGGVTFSPSWTLVTGGSVNYSAWDLGGDLIWVAGYGDVGFRISVATPTVAAPVTGLGAAASSSESAIAVDGLGTAYFARGDATNGVRLWRALSGSTTFGTAAGVDAAGRYPSLAAPKAGGAVVLAYDRAGVVWVTVRAY
jgi:hypothetical protein